MRPLLATCLFYLLFLSVGMAAPRTFRPVDGEINKGQFIDVGPKADQRLWVRYCAIADSGVELEVTKGNKLLWKAYVEPVGVAHSAYQQAVEVEIDPLDKNKFQVTSIATGGNIFETRSLKSGKRLSRRVTNVHSMFKVQ